MRKDQNEYRLRVVASPDRGFLATVVGTFIR
jgi:hypothetical protein